MSFAWVAAHQSAGVQRLTRERSDCGWKKNVTWPKALSFRERFHNKFEVFHKTDVSENN